MMNAAKAPDAELISDGFSEVWTDHQFLECLTRTAGGETWTARANDGRDRLIQFLSGVPWESDEEKKRLNLLRSLQHDALEPMELIASGDHRLALITDLCTKSLASRFQECQAAGLPGVPRPELLARLNAAAEALDDLVEEFGVRHLGLTPRHLTLKNGRLRLLHFGVVELIHLPLGRQAAVNPRYSAPRLFEELHPSSDAYSLALIYCELLTGVPPLRNLKSRQPASSRRCAQPDLSMVPLMDRAVLLRALHADPNRRFAACTDFMAALCAKNENRTTLALSGPTSCLSDAAAEPVFPTTRARMRQLINSIVVGVAGDLEVREYRNARYLLHPGCRLEHQCFARIARGVSKLMAEGFRFQWNAVFEEMSEDKVVLLVPLSATLWRRLTGVRPGLRVVIDMPQTATTTDVSEVRVRIEPVGCSRAEAKGVMEETAPQLLDSLRTFFQAQPERRSHARLPLDQVVEASPVLDGGTEGKAVASRARDISMQGMKFHSPCLPLSQRVNIRLPGWSSDAAISLPASVVRAIPCGDGRYEVSVRFLIEEVNA